MSQNVIDTESDLGRVRVRSGWDVPSQELYCSVEPLELIRGPQELPGCFFKTSYGSVDEVLESLREAGIQLPSTMLEAVEDDLTLRVGNVIRVFEESGALVDLRQV